MNSIRKWLYRPKKTDNSLLAQFYFADEELNLVAAELDSFDGRKDPERCTMLVNQLRVCQDKVLTVIQKTMEDAIPGQRANRDFRVKFPDDVLQDSLAGQLWFGAECLAAGSSILNREVESASMRPLARALTKNLDSLRCILRDQCLRSVTEYTERIKEALVIFDKLFAEFELSYVSAMVPVKTMKEYDMLQEVSVLFSETVHRALKIHLLTQDMIDDYDPALMFTIPRLAIVCGLLIYPEGPLNPDMEPTNMTEMYRPFQTLLYKIRELLYTLSTPELSMLEKSLCSSEEPDVSTPSAGGNQPETLLQLQIDQGFDEGGEGIVNLDGVGSNILVHTPNSGSPVTPVNLNPEMTDFDTVSPSSTIVEGGFIRFASPSSLTQTESEVFASLNKSESQDSGLHSENVSTSDTVTVDCAPLPSQEVEGTSVCKVTSSEKSKDKKKLTLDIGETVTSNSSDMDSHQIDTKLCDTSSTDNDTCDELGLTNEDACLKSCCRLETGSEVHHMCREIVEEIVLNAVHFDDGADCDEDTDKCDSATGTAGMATCDINSMIEPSDMKGDKQTNQQDEQPGPPPVVARQFSWQYNVQFAIPRISMSDQEIETGGDRVSTGSFSSDSTLSDNQKDIVSEFVSETLASMARNGEHHGDISSLLQSQNIDSQTIEIDPNVDSRLDFIGSGEITTQNSSSTDLVLDQNNSVRTNASCDRNLPTVGDYLDLRVSPNSTNSPHQSSANQTNQKQKTKVKKDRKGSVEHIKCKTGAQSSVTDKSLEVPRVQRLKYTESVSSSCSSCQSTSSECDCDKDCTCAGSETSSYNSETNDEEEIALAIQAAEIASRNEARSRFRSSSDLIHRLFVCIAGVADQLQTNYASDLRHILKCVFELHSTNIPEPEESPTTTPESQGDNEGPISPSVEPNNQTSSQRTSNSNNSRPPASPRRIFDEPPEWVPDDEVERCTACKSFFTFMRRRHHCRNCGKIFCGKCSSTTVPLPQYGHQKPVRVCHRCFLYQVSHFTVSD